MTHERNVEAIHRAGADFVLSYTTPGVEAVMSTFRAHPPVLLGEGIELFSVQVPRSIAGLELKDTGIGSRSWHERGRSEGSATVGHAVDQGDGAAGQATLLLLGSYEQRWTFAETFGGE